MGSDSLAPGAPSGLNTGLTTGLLGYNPEGLNSDKGAACTILYFAGNHRKVCGNKEDR